MRVAWAVIVIMMGGCSVDLDRFVAAEAQGDGGGGVGGAAVSSSSVGGGGAAVGGGGPADVDWCGDDASIVFADDFQRGAVDMDWGTGNPGPATYRYFGGSPANYSVEQDSGRIELNGDIRRAQVELADISSLEVHGVVRFETLPPAEDAFATFILHDAGKDRWEARLQYEANLDRISLLVVDVTDGSGSTLNQETVVSGVSATQRYHVRFRAQEESGEFRLKAMAWSLAQDPPVDWMIDEKAASLAPGTRVGFGATTEGGANAAFFSELMICSPP